MTKYMIMRGSKNTHGNFEYPGFITPAFFIEAESKEIALLKFKNILETKYDMLSKEEKLKLNYKYFLYSNDLIIQSYNTIRIQFTAIELLTDKEKLNYDGYINN